MPLARTHDRPPFVFSLSVSFFFKGRRRHTRCLSDWISDVCSSDLLFRRYLHPHIGARGRLFAQPPQQVRLAQRDSANGRRHCVSDRVWYIRHDLTSHLKYLQTTGTPQAPPPATPGTTSTR